MKRMTAEQEATKIRELAGQVRDAIGEVYGVTIVEGDLPDPVGMQPQDFWERANIVGIARARVQREMQAEAQAPPAPAPTTPSWVEWAKKQEEKVEEEKEKADREKRTLETTDPRELHDIWMEEREAKAEKEKGERQKVVEKARAQAVAETKVEPSPLEGITDPAELYSIHQREQELLKEQGKESTDDGGEEG